MQPISADTTPVVSPGTPGHGSLRHPLMVALISLELVLLAIQFLLGTFVNLFVALPSATSGMYGMMALMFTPGVPILAAHMMTGMVLGGLALIIFAVSSFSRSGLLIATTGVAFASIVGAGVSGMEFLFSSQNGAYSYGMAIGFLLAFTFAFLSLVVVVGARR